MSAIGLALLMAAGCAGKSHPAEQNGRTAGGDASQLQGTWEQRPEEGAGAAAANTPKQRVVKQIRGDTETVTTYGPNGQVVHAQTARFRLSRSGDVPVYTFFDRRITAGPEQGRAEDASKSFVYRLRGDEFDEVWGLLPGQEQRELMIKRWKRTGQ